MYGRDRELRVVADLLRVAEAGRGGMLLVEGEPGIGKTSLLRQAAAAAAERGFALSWGSADQPSQMAPMGAPVPAAPALGQLLTRSPPMATAAAGREHVTALHQAGLSPERRQPGLPEPTLGNQLLIMLDDLQWADKATLWRLRCLPSQPRAGAPLWILARSTVAADNDLERLFAHLECAGAVRMQLGPLDEATMADMAAGTLGAMPDHGLCALAAGAGGNPLLLIELLGGLRDEGRIRTEGGLASLVPGQLPQRLQSTVRCWLGDLCQCARQLLEVGAVLGRSFPVDRVAALLGETPAGLLPAIEAAIETGILIATPDSLAFRRDLVWQAIAEGVPTPARQALHLQAGELYFDQGGPAADTAAHLISGTRPGDTNAVARLDRAAQSFLASSPQTAADLALKALELAGPADQHRFSRTVTAAEALAAAGRLSEAAELARSTLAEPVPVITATQLRSVISSILFYSGRPSDAVSEAQRVLAEPELTREVRESAEVALMLGICAAMEDTRWATARAEVILAGADHRGEAAVVGALLALATIGWSEARLNAALDLARDAVRRASTGSDIARRALARLILVSMLTPAGLLDEAGAVVSRLAEDVTALGHTVHGASPDILAAHVALAAGRLTEAVTRAEAGLRLAETLGTHLLTPFGLSVLAMAALRSGDLGAAVEHVQNFQARLSEYGPTYGRTRCLVVAAQVAEATGGPHSAAALVADIYPKLKRRRCVLLADPTAPALLVRFAVSQGDREHAEAVAAAAENIAASNPGFAALTAAAAHSRGLLDRDADALNRAAIADPDPWARASAAEDLGVLFAQQQAHKNAVQSLDISLAGYDQTGAQRDAARVRRRLRRLGVRRRNFTYADRPGSGWASLTDTERAVSNLVAQGLTNQKIANQMFLSVHTVAFHLRQVFRKLDIGSRVDLARVLTERSQPGETQHVIATDSVGHLTRGRCVTM